MLLMVKLILSCATATGGIFSGDELFVCAFPDTAWYRITDYCTEIVNSEELGLCLPLTARSGVFIWHWEGISISSVDQRELKLPQFWLACAGYRSEIMMPMALCEEHQCSEGGFHDLKRFFPTERIPWLYTVYKWHCWVFFSPFV